MEYANTLVERDNFLVCIFDKSEHVPINKTATQLKRRQVKVDSLLLSKYEAAFQEGKVPFGMDWKYIKHIDGALKTIESKFIEHIKHNLITGDNNYVVVDSDTIVDPIMINRNEMAYKKFLENITSCSYNDESAMREYTEELSSETIVEAPEYKNEIGEFDIAHMYWIDKLTQASDEKMRYLVRIITSDTDMISTSLLYYESLIERNEIEKNTEVHIDLELLTLERRMQTIEKKLDSRKSIYINVLGDGLLNAVDKDTISHPIRNFVYLWLTTGNDYNTKLYRGISGNLINDLMKCYIKDHKKYGPLIYSPSAKEGMFLPDMIYMHSFMGFLYDFLKNHGKDNQVKSDIFTAGRKCPFSCNVTQSILSRALWTLNYHLWTHKLRIGGVHKIIDPLDINDGLSVWGWKMSTDKTKIETTTETVFSKGYESSFIDEL